MSQIKKVCAFISTMQGQNINAKTIFKVIPNMNSARVILTRLEKEEILKKVSKGTWQIKDQEKLINRIESKHNKHNKRVIGGVIHSTGTKALKVMPHNISYMIKLREKINYDLQLFGWVKSKPINNWHKYTKRFYLESGAGATVTYNDGVKNFSIEVAVDRVEVHGDLCQEHIDYCVKGAMDIIKGMERDFNIRGGLLTIKSEGHFAFRLPLTVDNFLRGKVTINNAWWKDSSLSEFFQELETEDEAEAQRLWELPIKLDELQKDTTDKIEEVRREIHRSKCDNTKVMNFLGDIAELIVSNNDLLKTFIQTVTPKPEMAESTDNDKEKQAESTNNDMRYIG